MTTLRESKWWDQVGPALRSDPLDEVAARFRVDPEQLRRELADEGAGLAAERTAWWPEAMRMRATTALRAIARAFFTEPRRIRRALARLNVRVAGRDIPEDAGVSQLSGLRDMLGREPDSVVARMGKVIPEAVQGERRRLNIPAYVQRRRVRLSREEEAWIRGPKRGRRAKVHVEENLQVVRRPLRTDENAHRPSGWGVGHAEPRARVVGEAPIRPPRIDRDFFRSSGAEEMEKLLQPVKQRDGRMRIVRSDSSPLLSPESRPPVHTSPPAVSTPPTPPRPRLPSLASPPARALPAAPTAPAIERPRLPSVGAMRAAPVPAPEVQPAVVAASGEHEWLVYLPDTTAPLRVHAADIAQAIAAAGRIVPASVLRHASVWRADEAP